MILYNVTVTIDPQVEEAWIAWMKKTHIPNMMRTGCFEHHKFLKLMTDRPDVDGTTYAIQYFATDSGKIDLYLADHAPALRKSHSDLFGDKSAAFRTLLEEI